MLRISFAEVAAVRACCRSQARAVFDYTEVMTRKRISLSRLAHGNEIHREFDFEFWRNVGAEGRFAAAWEMVGEVMAMRGMTGRQARLQKSVVHIVRLRRTEAKRRAKRVIPVPARSTSLPAARRGASAGPRFRSRG